MPCDTRKHFGADFLAIMESEHKIRPALPLKYSVRAGLALDRPADAVEGCKNATSPLSMATRSCGDKKLSELGYGFAVLKPVRKRSKGERFNRGFGFFRRVAVSHDSRQLGDFGNPSTVTLLLKLNS